MRSSWSSTAVRATLGLAALAAALPSCERPPTQLAFRVLAEDLVPGWCDGAAYRGDPRCPAGAYRIEQILVRVCRGGPCRAPESLTCVDGDLFCRTYVDSPRPTVFSLLPGDITVAPADPSSPGRVGISVVASVRVPGAGGDAPTREYIPRRFVVPFVPETTQLVEVWLTSLCIGAVCPPETTCGRRSCERVDSPPTRPFTPLPAPGPVDGGDRDVTFDVRPRVDAADAADDVAPADVGLDAVEAAADAPPDAAVDVLDVLDGRDDRVPGALDVAPADVELGADGAADAPPDGPGDGGGSASDAADTPDVSDVVDAGPPVVAAAGTTAVGAGGHHTCLALRGAVWCWGKNEAYRLDDTDPFRARPARVALPQTVDRLAVGLEHTCAWSTGIGSIYCWGRNDEGQLGGGTAGHEPMRVAVAGVPTPSDVAVGNRFTCAVARTGAVYCWGVNTLGQCGTAAPGPVVLPQLVPGVSNARRVVAGAAHACALLGDGSVHCWGGNAQAQLGRAPSPSGAPAPVASLSTASELFAGANHTCAVVGGAVYCWGAADRLRLGSPRPTPAEPVPQLVPAVTVPMGAAVAAGDDASCVVANAAGEAVCWGAGAFGQLGHTRGPIGESAPTGGAVQGLRGVVGLSVGARHACARTAGGVFCWGSDLWGQRGAGQAARPRAAPESLTFVGGATPLGAVAAGGAHACAVARNAVHCWGEGREGQLGNGQTANASAPTPITRIGGAGSPTALCAGDRHTCMIYGRDVWCWGDNTMGQLGVADVTGRSATPVQVPGLPAAAESLSCGAGHTCARLADAPDGAVWCWGDNRERQLGVTGVTSRVAPGAVTGVTARALSSRGNTTCALQADGAARCWGAGSSGEFGGGMSAAASEAPVTIPGVTGAGGLAAGLRHLCAWRAAEALCWGADDAAQLGRGAGTLFMPRPPGAVLALTAPITALAAGPKHTCAIHGGALSCWGANGSRECGVDDAERALAPTPVALGAPPAAVVAGGRGSLPGAPAATAFTCAATDAALRCWGSNEFGELGDGAAFSSAPVEVMLPAP